jgi:hypothetical protein
MPDLCRFYGIVIRLYFADHGPPHFPALYGGDELLLAISTLAVLHGRLPPRAQGMVVEWASQHHNEPLEAWERAQRLEPIGRIDPLP